MRLRLVREPFDHPDYIFEPKHDGFRAVAYLQNRASKLVSRNQRNLGFEVLKRSLAKLPVENAIIDGEIICVDAKGVSQFNQLLGRKGEPVLYAFDLLWLDGEDLRQRPLIERKKNSIDFSSKPQYANTIQGSNKMRRRKINWPRSPLRSRIVRLAATATACSLLLGVTAFADGFNINPTFTANFNADFGSNAAAAQAAWIAAANIFTSNFSNNISVNILVDAVPGTSIFGQSFTFPTSDTYADLRNRLVADAKSADQLTETRAGGSVTVADPTGGKGTWFVTRAQAKALGIIASDSALDGGTNFGAGFSFTFSGPITAGTFDFKGVAAHEISEVLGRLGLGGGTTGFNSLLDLFSYSGAGTRVLGNGGGPGLQGSFSIDNGTTLLKQYNDQFSNGLDFRDWAPGTNDAFNQFSFPGVTNAVSDVDLREINVIGYDRLAAVPEPSTGILLISGLVAGCCLRRRKKT
jgi:hypothetical protein